MSLCAHSEITFDGQVIVRTMNCLCMAWKWEMKNFKHLLSFELSVCVIPWAGDHLVWLQEQHKPNLLMTAPALLTFITITSLLVWFWHFRRLQHPSPSAAFCLLVKTVVLCELQQCFKQSAHTLQNRAVWINQPYIIIYWNNNTSFSFRK